MTKSQVASPTEGLQECLKNNTVQDKRMGKVVDIILLSDRIQGQNRRMGYWDLFLKWMSIITHPDYLSRTFMS